MPDQSLPLAGVRVLDFTRVLAGPLCTMLLGDMGADVIKVESPLGDETRQWGPPYAGDPADGMSAYYLSVNRNKRSIVLDLKGAHDQAIARQIAAQSQIVVENLKPGGMAKFGLGYDDLKAFNPALVYASITGFGQFGPYRDRPGYDHVLQAMSGLMSITGATDGEPYKVGVAIVDVVTGLFALSSLLAALRHAEITGQGQHLDLALLDSAIAALVNVASNTLVSGQAPRRYGNEHPNIVPYQVFSAADGDFVVAVGNDGQFAALCRLMGVEHLIHDPRYATNPARVAHRTELVAELAETFRTRPAKAWVDAILEAGIPTGPINSLPQIIGDPQVEARGLMQEMPLDNGALWRFVGNPVGFSETPPVVRYPPPLLGQHTDEVLRELGIE
ncbi:MAG: CoA transferase [bacterium]|nr:CoA transferase [bacterium]